MTHDGRARRDDRDGRGGADETIDTDDGDTVTDRQTDLRWLDVPRRQGVTWGVPWPRGTVRPGEPFGLADAEGRAVPVQSWPLATWPDGSVKWSAHAIGPQDAPAARYGLTPGARPAAPDDVLLPEAS